MAQTIDPEKAAALLRECAVDIVLPLYHRGISDADIFEKTSKFDIATTADHEVEEKLKRVLPEMFKGSIVIGEETVHDTPHTLDALDNQEGVIFVVDPVDGTNNFAKGNRHFAVMMSCVIDGKTQYGWILDVLSDEMTIAAKGEGAFKEEQRLKTSAPKALSNMSGYASMRHFPRTPINVREIISELKDGVTDLKSLGCAAHEYLNVARGYKDFSIYADMKPWDHLAGALIVREAGGVVHKWDGSTYKPNQYRGGLIAASCEESWKLASEHFKLADISSQVMQYLGEKHDV